MRELTFYFDYISNNAYLAWTQLDKLAAAHGLTIRPVPVLFAGLLKSHNNVGPAEIAPKRKWMSKNILRKTGQLGVPMSPPLHHPFNPLLALRASSLDMDEAARKRFITAMFDAVWVNRRHVSDPEVIAEIANEQGLDGADILTQAQSKQASEMLKQQTARAVEEGAFGIPTMMVEGEMFFGYDDFVYLDLFLKGEDPLTAEAWASWNQHKIVPSAMRKEVAKKG